FRGVFRCCRQEVTLPASDVFCNNHFVEAEKSRVPDSFLCLFLLAIVYLNV
ncbi:hypothetical protein ABH899_004356, partial [Paenibacillus sp. RC84]